MYTQSKKTNPQREGPPAAFSPVETRTGDQDMTRKTPRKIETPLEADADTVIYCTGTGVYISRKEDPETVTYRFNEKEREIIRKMEKGEI